MSRCVELLTSPDADGLKPERKAQTVTRETGLFCGQICVRRPECLSIADDPFCRRGSSLPPPSRHVSEVTRRHFHNLGAGFLFAR